MKYKVHHGLKQHHFINQNCVFSYMQVLTAGSVLA